MQSRKDEKAEKEIRECCACLLEENLMQSHDLWEHTMTQASETITAQPNSEITIHST